LGTQSPANAHRIICGFNAVDAALRQGGHSLHTVWIANAKHSPRLKEICDLAVARGIPLAPVPEAQLTELAGLSSHQGVVAAVATSPLLPIGQLITQCLARHPIPPLVIVDGVKDPRNFGAIIRSAAVFGIGGVIIPARRAVGLTATVAKAAAGGLEYVPIAQVTNISQCIEGLKRQGFWIVGTDENATTCCHTYLYPSPLVLVFGEEGRGISALVKRHCDALVRIPAGGPLRSLNVAVAAAVLFYEVIGRAGGEPHAAAG
jgi:23S rRNA (guanosine2251-2'-O)-methyltransferase